MIFRHKKGSIMLESVMVLPIFVILVFYLIQMTFVWVAKQMTYYAAYCGARAALVYNPKDYCADLQTDGSWKTDGFVRQGVVHEAASTVLSWVSWSLNGSDYNNFFIGTYQVPLSSTVRNQVSVSVVEYEKIGPDADRKDEKGNATKAEIHEQFPAVTVSVRFKFPLFVPLGGMIVGYFFGANDQICIPTGSATESMIGAVDSTRDAISLGGFTATNGDSVHNYMKMRGNYTDADSGLSYYSMVLTETCTMAKPYKTDTFPLMPECDKPLFKGRTKE